MGGGYWDASAWDYFQSSRISGRGTAQIYSARTMNRAFSPENVIREACDSAAHPCSTPIILGLDVTGSMSRILQVMAEKIGMMMTQIYSRKPVPDPQISFAAIGDAVFDSYPLQVTQFESDNRIVEQLTQIYFERGGGGNGFESYPLAWYFAARHTACDQFTKRGQKGFLFTFGDDGFPDVLTKRELRRIFGDALHEDMPTEAALAEAGRRFEIYHFCMEQGGTYRETDLLRWQELLGENAIRVRDYSKIPELVVSLLELHAGKDKKEIIASWDGSTALAVADALAGVTLAQSRNADHLISF